MASPYFEYMGRLYPTGQTGGTYTAPIMASPAQPSGSVLGTKDVSTPPPQQTGLDPHINPATGQWDDNYYAATHGGGGDGQVPGTEALETGYSEYTRQLESMLNENLPMEKTAQEQIVASQLERGKAGLATQKEEGMELLGKQRTEVGENQARNLRDLAANIRNAFMAGSVYLGARGAGDSSAAGQYGYALGKVGTRERGELMRKSADILNEIGDREAKLQNIYNEQIKELQSESDQKLLGITQWFSEQQRAIKEALGTGAIAKGQDITAIAQRVKDYAISQLGLIEQEASNKRSALEQWAMSNAQTIQQLRANMQGIQAFSPNLPQARPVTGMPSFGGGNMTVPGYYPGGQTEEEQRSLFG